MSNEQIIEEGLDRSWRPQERGRPSAVAEPAWRSAPVVLAYPYRRLCIILLGWVLCFVLLGLLVWVATWLQPLRPTRWVLLGTHSADNLSLPHNAYGWQSLADTAAFLQSDAAPVAGGTRLLRLAGGPVVVRAGSPWDGGLLREFEERTVVVYLSLHGGSDLAGAYLLPDDATVQDAPENRIRLDAVFDRLAALSADKHKVLLLDATQLVCSWELGILHNEFASELAKFDHRIAEIPNLVVISASGANQHSWVCPLWRQTVFGHFVLEGLQGIAPDQNRSGRTDVWDLFCHVRSRVSGWVQTVYGAEQTPVLLPSGRLGEQRALAIDLLPAVDQYRPPEVGDLVPFVPPPELTAAWQTHEQLSRQHPRPYARLPHLWRRYEETLVRYEQLLVTGQTSAAAEMHARLADLGIQLKSTLGKSLIVASPVSAPLWDVAGASDAGSGTGRTRDAVRQLASQTLQDLWSAPAAEYRQRWLQANREAGDNPWSQQLLKAYFCRALVAQVAQDPSTNLAIGCRIADIFRDAIVPVDPPLHFLLMLHRDLPPDASGPYWDVVRLALTTRLLAEDAALAARDDGPSYGEQTYRWVQAEVDAADEQRRQGEDLLFAGPAQADAARQRLERAQQAYAEAQARAAQVAEAFEVRDYVLWRLPIYSRSAAIPLLASAVPERGLLRTVESLWEETHELVRRLQTPAPQGISEPLPDSRTGGPGRSLVDQTETVRHAFESLENAVAQYLQDHASQDEPRLWREGYQVLRSPLVPPKMRLHVLTTQHEALHNLIVRMSAEPSAAVPARDGQLTAAKYAAYVQGRMALAVLGRTWFNACLTPQGETFEQLAHRLEVFQVEQEWLQSLVVAGTQIGDRWQRMPAAIDLSPAPGADAATSDRLRASDELSRFLPGLESLLSATAPADRYRRRLLQGLLVWQARRMFEDHWFAADPAETPYFRSAAIGYLSDAELLGPKSAEVDQLRAQVNQPGELVWNAPHQIQVTSEPSFRLTARLQPGPGTTVPGGFLVAWAEAGTGLEFTHPEAGKRSPRRVGQTPPDADPPPDEACAYALAVPGITEAETNPSDRPSPEKTRVRLVALFRGQRITADVPVEIHLPETVAAGYPPPDRGGVAVRASPELHSQFGDGRGAVAVVLDCSGSMGPVTGQPFTAGTKFAEATAALEQVLAGLPKGTVLSVWVFGQAIGPKKTVKEAEQTIRRILPPTPWEPDRPQQLRGLMAQLRYPALEPWNESPIMHAVLQAKEDLATTVGFKTLVVITDGMDNRFAHDAGRNPQQRSIPETLRQTFQQAGIVLNVIGFKVVAKEEAQAEAQFKVVEQLFPPGSYHKLNEARDLATVLAQSLRQRLRCWVQDGKNVAVPGTPAEGLDVSRVGANDQWFPGGLAPDSYKILTYAQRPVETWFALAPGDLLLLRLAATPAGVRFERSCFGADDYLGKPFQERNGWRLTVLQNQREEPQDLRLLTLLEQAVSPTEPILRQVHPGECWFEVSPRANTAAPHRLDWQPAWGYPAPAWNLHVPNWLETSTSPSPAEPLLRVWWNPDQYAPADFVLHRGADFQALSGLAGRAVHMGGDAVRLEDASLENHVVQIQPGVRRVEPCLVIRLSYPPGKPVWARVLGLDAGGVEHRFYSRIGKYTGLFWPVTPAQAARSVTGIGLVSLETFKHQAEERGYEIRMDQLPAPTPGDVPPPPVMNWR